jgi:23S rRNA (pseudouridine1915-N3)-methyltransferase
MKIQVAWIGKTKQPAIEALTSEYLGRLSRFVPSEGVELAGEAALQRRLEKAGTRPLLVLLDARGRQLSSEELAGFLEQHQSRGTPALMFAVGPADGFSEAMRQSADFQLSLGKLTLAHELARVVLLEQLYRAFTILKRHPYHLGHLG